MSKDSHAERRPEEKVRAQGTKGEPREAASPGYSGTLAVGTTSLHLHGVQLSEPGPWIRLEWGVGAQGQPWEKQLWSL